MSISLRIKELRLLKNMTQKELSSELKIDSSQFSKIEQGKLHATVQQLMDISSFFDVSLDWLCFGSNISHIKDNKDEIPEAGYKELADARKDIIKYQKEEIDKLKNIIAQLTMK